jgi:hypothetical protein
MPPLDQVLSGLAAGLVDGQAALDAAGLDSIDAFEETGMPPTVYAWHHVRLEAPVALALMPKLSAGTVSAAKLSAGSGGVIAVSVRYLESPQGVDDPHPQESA